jgi:hypothetical protein
MKRILATMALSALLIGSTPQSQAVELLISGGFENPGGATGEVPFWLLNETVTGSSASVDSAQLDGPVADTVLWLKPFAGGQGLGAAQGNFDADGDVDGRDFLVWQRGGSPGGVGSATDLAAWQSNYGTSGGANKVNARLIQTVPGVAGDTYTFQGSALFEDFYSGLVTTLGDASPFAGQASPTVTQFRMEFLNASNNVIGSPFIKDLRPEVTFPGFYTPVSLPGVAPAGTTSVRVVAEALDMVWNGSSSQVDPEVPGNDQSAFFNDFSLRRSGAPGTELLANADLNLGTPNALDFWNRAVNPTSGCCVITPTTPFGEILRTPSFADNAAVPGGTLGVWLSPFFGGWTNPDGTTRTGAGGVIVGSTTPVDGSIQQTVNAVPGGVYNFSGWMKFEPNYSGGVDIISNTNATSTLYENQPSPTQTLITLEFLNNVGVVIQSSVIDVKEERQALAACGGNANSAACGPSGWTQHTFTNVVAPAGAAQVRLRADMIDGVFNTDVGGGQSMFWDDFSLDGPAPPLSALTSVPEPTSVALIAFGLVAVGLRRGRRVGC